MVVIPAMSATNPKNVDLLPVSCVLDAAIPDKIVTTIDPRVRFR